MSVILFKISGVYQDMATAYEGLKNQLSRSSDDRIVFYKALRRMYYANVAAYLCQYHDDSPLSEKELAGIDTVQEIPHAATRLTAGEYAQMFLDAWSALRYNTVTNDGEQYLARESYGYLQSLADHIIMTALEV